MKTITSQQYTVALEQDHKFEKFKQELSDLEPWIRQFIRMLCNFCDFEDDLVQDVFAIAMSRYEKFDRKRSSLKTWLTNIARYVWLEKKRQIMMKKNQNLPLNDTDWPAVYTDPGNDIYEKERNNIIYNNLFRLPKEYQEPIFLTKILGKSGQEAADILGIGYQQLRNRIHEGIDMIREIMRNKLL